MPTLNIIFNDMSTLGRFFSKSKFKLSFMSINSLYVGIFYLSGEQSDDLFFKKNCHRERSVAISYCIANCTRLPLLLLSSQRRLLCCGPIAVDDHVITSDRRKRDDLMRFAKSMRLPHSLRSSQQSLQQPRLVNNTGKLIKMILASNQAS
jgi:hypothetical protein